MVHQLDDVSSVFLMCVQVNHYAWMYSGPGMHPCQALRIFLPQWVICYGTRKSGSSLELLSRCVLIGISGSSSWTEHALAIVPHVHCSPVQLKRPKFAFATLIFHNTSSLSIDRCNPETLHTIYAAEFIATPPGRLPQKLSVKSILSFYVPSPPDLPCCRLLHSSNRHGMLFFD